MQQISTLMFICVLLAGCSGSGALPEKAGSSTEAQTSDRESTNEIVADSTVTDSSEQAPTFGELAQFAGTKLGTNDFQNFVAQFDFSENHKREKSWGSSFGVFIEISNAEQAIVGIRPKGTGFGSDYAGELPNNLMAGDSVKIIMEKLGEPIRTTGDASYFTMEYEKLEVHTAAGALFEIWLKPAG